MQVLRVRRGWCSLLFLVLAVILSSIESTSSRSSSSSTSSGNSRSSGSLQIVPKEEKEDKYDSKKERIKDKPKTAKIGSGTVQFMITNRMRGNLENELNYLAEEVDVMDPQIASVVIERGLSRPSSGMPKSWIKIQQEIPFLEKQMTRLKNSMLKVADFTIYKIAPVAVTAYTIVYILPNFVRLIVNKSAGLIKGNKPLKSSSKGDISKNSKSFSWKGIGTNRKSNEGSKIQNVDIKSMSKIFGR